ncbi:hypothetical protein AN220_30415, partial [Streptomyces nanshensis]
PNLNNLFKRPDPITNTLWHVPVTFLAHGAGEGLAGFLVVGAVYGKWEFQWNDWVGGGTSALVHGGLHTGLTTPGHTLHNKLFPNGNLFTDYINNSYTTGGSGHGGDRPVDNSRDPGTLPPTRSRTGASPGSGLGARPDVRTAADPSSSHAPHPPRTAAPETWRDDAQRRWLAERLTVADLAGGPPPLAPDETVSVTELEAAGFAPGPGQRIAAVLGGGTLPVRDSGLTPLEQTALLMVRPGPWTEQLEAVAARASERIWESAFQDFAAGPTAAGATSEDVARAWDSARTLVLPAEAHAGRADARYAEEPLRESVRQVAGRLLGTGTGTEAPADSAAPLADRVHAVPEPAPRSPTGPAAASEQEPAAVPPTATPP